MNVEELRFIIRQQKQSSILSTFWEFWITDEILAQALTEIDQVYRDRLEALKGISRKDYEHLALPKLRGGLMKPGLSNVSGGARAAFWSLARVLRQLQKRNKLQEAGRQAARGLICPHCGSEITVSLTVT